MKKQCQVHQNYTIEFICFETTCFTHLACYKCLTEKHYEHVEKCQSISEFTQIQQQNRQQIVENNLIVRNNQFSSSHSLSQLDFNRRNFQQFVKATLMSIENMEQDFKYQKFYLIESSTLKFMRQYHNSRNIKQIQILLKSLLVQQISKETFIIQLDKILYQNYILRIIELKKQYQNLKNENSNYFIIDNVSLFCLENKLIKHLKDYTRTRPKNNVFRIVQSEKEVEQLEVDSTSVRNLAIYKKPFKSSNKYKIIIEFSEMKVKQNNMFYIGFTKDFKRQNKSIKAGADYFISLSQLFAYSEVTYNNNPGSILGVEIEQDLEQQRDKIKSSKLEIILNLQKNKIITSFKKHQLIYSQEYQNIEEDGMDSFNRMFSGQSYFLYLLYGQQSFKCKAIDYQLN